MQNPKKLSTSHVKTESDLKIITTICFQEKHTHVQCPLFLPVALFSPKKMNLTENQVLLIALLFRCGNLRICIFCGSETHTVFPQFCFSFSLFFPRFFFQSLIEWM